MKTERILRYCHFCRQFTAKAVERDAGMPACAFCHRAY